MNVERLKAMAENLKGHAWLERFRAADYENTNHEQSPEHANAIASFVDELLNEILKD